MPKLSIYFCMVLNNTLLKGNTISLKATILANYIKLFIYRYKWYPKEVKVPSNNHNVCTNINFAGMAPNKCFFNCYWPLPCSEYNQCH